MQYDNLPIYRSAMQLCVYIETIVRGFEKYHKYTIGQDMRNFAKELLFSIYRANVQSDKSPHLEAMVQKCEEMKMLLAMAKELRVFKSFAQFEHSVKLTIEVCRQAQAWYKHYAGVAK